MRVDGEDTFGRGKSKASPYSIYYSKGDRNRREPKNHKKVGSIAEKKEEKGNIHIDVDKYDTQYSDSSDYNYKNDFSESFHSGGDSNKSLPIISPSLLPPFKSKLPSESGETFPALPKYSSFTPTPKPMEEQAEQDAFSKYETTKKNEHPNLKDGPNQQRRMKIYGAIFEIHPEILTKQERAKVSKTIFADIFLTVSFIPLLIFPMLLYRKYGRELMKKRSHFITFCSLTIGYPFFTMNLLKHHQITRTRMFENKFQNYSDQQLDDYFEQLKLNKLEMKKNVLGETNQTNNQQ